MSQQDTPFGSGDDLHALAAAYAIDAVDATERAAFEAHLSTCQTCQREVAELSEVTVALTEDLAVEPSAALRERLLAQVAVTPQDAIEPTDELETLRAQRASEAARQGGARHARSRRSPSRWLLAGAAAAVIAIGAIAVTQWPQDTPDPTVVAVQEVLEAPDAVRTTESLDGANVTVVAAYSLDRAVLQTKDLEPAPEGQDYQLWFVNEDGTAVSAGLLPPDTDEVLLEGDPSGAVAVGITIEPAGGSDQPTSEPIVAVPLEG